MGCEDQGKREIENAFPINMPECARIGPDFGPVSVSWMIVAGSLDNVGHVFQNVTTDTS